MQVGIDVKYMHTNFGGRDLSGFGDIATFKIGQIPFRSMGVKKLNQVESAHKIMQVGIEIACVPTIKLVYLPQKQ